VPCDADRPPCLHPIPEQRRPHGRSPAQYRARRGDIRAQPWDVSDAEQGRYDLAVFGPNGFLRVFRGTASPDAQANLDVRCRYDAESSEIVLVVTNRGPRHCDVTATNAYGGASISRLLDSGDRTRWRFRVNASHGWYDISIEASSDDSFLHRLAGHLEDGKDSVSDPAFGHVAGQSQTALATSESVKA
jgi:phospholipase C